jgi:2-iminobutanoate/2-iminopropanoate deaminase
MPKKLIQTSRGAPPLGAYSQGFRTGDFVFTAGTGPIDPRTGKVVGSTIEEQTHLTLENIGAILEAAGATYADVVKATVHLSDPLLFSRFNAVYSEYFPDPKPVRTTVGSRMDQVPGMMVEIDVIAYTGA